jgi:hypothetical protein
MTLKRSSSLHVRKYQMANGPSGAGAMSALGQKPTCALQNLMSALPPIATAKADMPQTLMSALHPKADMCSASADVR